jgi:hypothetical protein
VSFAEKTERPVLLIVIPFTVFVFITAIVIIAFSSCQAVFSALRLI